MNRETQVSRIAFSGNETFDDALLHQQIATEAPGTFQRVLNALTFWSTEQYPFSPIELQRDVVRLRRFYNRQGFLHPEIDYEARYDSSDNDIRITFVVEEGPPLLIQELEYVGPDGRAAYYQIPAELREDWVAFRREIALRTGDRFTELDLITFQDRALAWLKNRGFAFAETSADTTRLSIRAGNQIRDYIDITVTVDTGPVAYVDSIQVEGNESVADRVVRREIPLKVGEPFSYREMVEGQRRVFGLDIFRVALASLPDQPRDSTVTVRYQVREAQKRFVTAQTGYSNQSGIGLEGQWTHRNFMGGARRLTVTGLWDTGIGAALTTGETALTQVELSVALRQPYLFVRRLSGVLRPFYESLSYTFDGARFGVDATALYEFYNFRHASATHRVAYEAVRVNNSALFQQQLDSLGLTLEDLPGLDLGSLDLPDLSYVTRFLTANVTLSGRFGKADNYLTPTRGFLVSPSVGVSLPGSEVQYVRMAAEVVGALPLNDWISLGGKLRVGRLFPFGASADQSDLEARAQLRNIRFYAGGSDDVRGYGENLLGPKRIIIGRSDNLVYDPLGGLAKISGTAEVRFPFPLFGPNWTSAAFLDFGHLGNELVFDPGAFRYGVGAGIRIKTQVGYIRIDGAYKLNPHPQDVFPPDDFLRGDETASFWRRFRLHLNFGPWI